MTYLVDTSAWHRLSKPALAGRRASLIADDSVSICELVALKVLFSARSADDYDRTARNISGFRMAPTRPTEFERARDVQQRLAHQGGLHHRSVTIADLIIAATAESAGLTVLHYDEDYDRIAAVTGQPTEWLAARGTL